MQGHYFFADYVTDRIWSLKLDAPADPADFDGTNYTDLIEWTDLIQTDFGTVNSVSSFAEDANGNLYILDLGGEIFQITGVQIPEPNVLGLVFVAGLAAFRRHRLLDIPNRDL